MDINNMTRRELEQVPDRKWDEDIGDFDSLIILPQRRLHDSGYRCMDFIAVKDGKPIRKLSGGSDVIRIEGIGGFGFDWLHRYNGCPELVPPRDWSIDCLAKSGLLQLFSHAPLKAGSALSSFEIYSNPTH